VLLVLGGCRDLLSQCQLALLVASVGLEGM
jgi:hypothetical protein